MMTMMVTQGKPYYIDRSDAGKQLAGRLATYKGNCVVFAIPNGGIPVAAEVAARLEADLDVVLVQKLPVPFNSGGGYGAISTDGVVVYNKPLMKRLGLTDREAQKHADRLKGELDRRTTLFREEQPFPWLVGKTAVIVDDGLVSGYTMAAAVRALRNHRAGKVVAAAPVSFEPAYQIVKTFADEVVCPIVSRSSWFAVAGSYANWRKLPDEEALSALRRFRREQTRFLVAARVPQVPSPGDGLPS